jgi:hypothetical protein
VISGHHDWFNVFQLLPQIDPGELIHDPGVVQAIQAIRGAQDAAGRAAGVRELMGRIG